jgi:hypothetical protein
MLNLISSHVSPDLLSKTKVRLEGTRRYSRLVSLSKEQILNMLKEGEIEAIDGRLSIEHCASVLDDMELIHESMTLSRCLVCTSVLAI